MQLTRCFQVVRKFGTMAAEFEVFLQGGAPWGFRLQGGKEFRAPLKIAKVINRFVVVSIT